MNKKPEAESDIELMRKLLKSAGVDIEGAKEKMEHEALARKEQERDRVQSAAQRKYEAEQIEKLLKELVKSGGIRVKVADKVVTDPNYSCPHCGNQLPRFDMLDHFAGIWWKNGLSRLDGVMGLLLHGHGFAEAQQRCGHCQKQVYVTVQVVV